MLATIKTKLRCVSNGLRQPKKKVILHKVTEPATRVISIFAKQQEAFFFMSNDILVTQKNTE